MVREWPLIGRAEELVVIAQATRAADRARGIVLSGAAGVGKSRLAREAVDGCGPRNARRRWIAATAAARSVPLGAFTDIATNFGPDPLRRVREVVDALIGDDGDRTVVVGVDDAHLLDDLSAFAVHQLVTRRLATVILTTRSGEHPPDAITTIWKDQHLQRLELQALSLAETTALVEHVLDGPVQSLAARRLWQFTQGNALYLRHLVDNEVNSGRITKRSGVWLWEGRPSLPPTLAELLETRIAQAPKPVRDVLDALAVAEPLDADVLATITDPDGPAEAESRGLVQVDTRVQPAAVRLAHPLFGEVRRSSGSLRLRKLRGRIATELARKPGTDPRDLVRRAVLTTESDLAPDPGLLTAAASAAMQLHDVRLAETLAERSVAAGGGVEAKMSQAMAITWQERTTDAEAILAELADQTTGPARAQVASVRAVNFAAILGDAARAERELDDAALADVDDAHSTATALRAMIDLVRGHARAAVDRAGTVGVDAPANDVAQMISILVLAKGFGDLGHIDHVESATTAGHDLADNSAEVAHIRLPLSLIQTIAYRLAGALTRVDTTVTRISHDTLDVPLEQLWHYLLAGMAAMSRGALAEAQRLLQESLSYLGTGDSGHIVRAYARLWLVTVTAMSGRAADAHRELDAIEPWIQEPQACLWDSERPIANAWVCAAEGATSQAISIVRDAAARESRLGRPAWEVLLLQTATQFGDPTTAPRLAELVDQVQGPRAAAAAAHATALASGNSDGLLDASRRYESFGARLAAADAAAHAVLAYQNAGRRGAALTASATAQRLARECQGADTPALRAATMPLPITARQREIITLAAQGLSNTEIAERLTMSVRSVQGHLFRASQRVGVNSRDELIAILPAH